MEILCRTYIVGGSPKPRPDNEKRPRPIIAHFTSYRDRHIMFSLKKLLKGTSTVIKKDLTSLRRATGFIVRGPKMDL